MLPSDSVPARKPDEDLSKAAEYAAMTPAERWTHLLALLEMSEVLLAANPNADAVRNMRDERSDEARALWRSLMARHAKDRP